MMPGCGTMLPTRSIVVRKPSRKPPFARSSMLDAGSLAIATSPARSQPRRNGSASQRLRRPRSIAGPRLRWQVNCATRARRRERRPSVAGAFLTEIWIVFAIIAGVIGLFVWDRLPVIAVCVGCAMALWATGRAHAQPGARRLRRPGDDLRHLALRGHAARWRRPASPPGPGRCWRAAPATSRFRLIVLMMLFCGVLSALISVNGAVAALLPVVVVLAVRLKRPPSQLLMPLVFGAHAGSMLALTGTPVNVLVYEASLDAGAGGFGYFEFAYVGVFLLIGTIAHRAPARLAAPAGAREPLAAARPQPARPHARRAVPPRRRRAPAQGAAGVAAGRPAAGRARPRRPARRDAS